MNLITKFKKCENGKRSFIATKLLMIVVIMTSCCGINASVVTSQCHDTEPKDLLALSLSDSPLTGVEIVNSDIEGYRLDETSILFGTDSSNVLRNCRYLPTEFSMRIRLRMPSNNRDNEFIFAMLGPDRRTRLAALRVQRSDIVFDHVTTASGFRSVRFKDDRLTEEKWHELILTVARPYITLTIDCEKSITKNLVDFPSRLSITNTRIQIGNRRRKRERFTGLLNEVKFQNGYDLSVSTCRDKPEEPPTTPTDEEEVLTCSYVGQTMKVGDETSCKKKERSERLDYVEDYDDINTNGISTDIEVFDVPGEGKFLITANKGRYSKLFKLNSTTEEFDPYQNLSAKNALDWAVLNINDEVFLAAAIPDLNRNKSIIYRWNSNLKQFVRHQFIKTYRAVKWKGFRIEKKFMFAVANGALENPKGNPIKSAVYYWEPSKRKFKLFQELATSGATDIEFFQTKNWFSATEMPVSVLVVANGFSASGSTRVNSTVFVWWQDFDTIQLRSITRFIPFQSIETDGAVDWEFFTINSVHYMALANPVRSRVTDPDRYDVKAYIYQFDIGEVKFIPAQAIQTQNVVDWEFFTIGTTSFLAAANVGAGGASDIGIVTTIYQWKGLERFQPVHSLPTKSIADIEYINIGKNHYLAMADPYSTRSRLYKIITY